MKAERHVQEAIDLLATRRHSAFCLLTGINPDGKLDAQALRHLLEWVESDIGVSVTLPAERPTVH